jgi:hypothetical protein
MVVAAGRSPSGSARQRGRSLVANRRPPARQGLCPRPLTSGFGSAPRGIRTPNRQIRSQPSPVPARPPAPSVSPLVLVNRHIADPSRASVPARHARHGRNVVAVSGDGCQTEVWRPEAGPAVLSPSTRSRIWCSTPWKTREPAARLLKGAGRADRPSAGIVSGARLGCPCGRLRPDEEAGSQPQRFTAGSSY